MDTKVLDLSLLWREKVRPQVSNVSEGHQFRELARRQWPRDKSLRLRYVGAGHSRASGKVFEKCTSPRHGPGELERVLVRPAAVSCQWKNGPRRSQRRTFRSQMMKSGTRFVLARRREAFSDSSQRRTPSACQGSRSTPFRPNPTKRCSQETLHPSFVLNCWREKSCAESASHLRRNLCFCPHASGARIDPNREVRSDAPWPSKCGPEAAVIHHCAHWWLPLRRAAQDTVVLHKSTRAQFVGTRWVRACQLR